MWHHSRATPMEECAIHADRTTPSSLAGKPPVPAALFALTDPARALDASQQTAMRRSLITIATNQIPIAIAANIVVAVCTSAVLLPEVPIAALLAWLVLICLVGALRLRLPAGMQALAPGADAAAMARCTSQMALITGVNGLLWGALGSVLVPAGDVELRAFVSCVVVAMAAAAVASNVAVPKAGRLFLAAALLPLAASWLFGPSSRTGIALGILCLFYLGVLLAFLRGTAAALAEAVTARLRNEQLKTEVETACARLADAVDAAEAASRSKSQFLANMSHEIRTPMNAVLGLASTLLDERLEPGHRETIVAIRESAGVLLRLINDILDFSRLEAGRISFEEAPFSPQKLTHNAVSILGARAAAKGLEIEINWDETLPQGLLGDAGRIRQVLLNLVANAVKFTERGRITVAVRRISTNGDQVTIEWQVRDTGIGIAPQALKTLFQDFSQADDSIARRFGGSGLGLAISRRLVEMMGGSIAAESAPNVGSVFHFRLTMPVVDAPAAAEEINAASADILHAALEARGRRLRVLLAEDSPTNQFVVTQLLKGFDIHVDIANNGLEAVDAAGRITYDLIYMDMRMPEMDGLQATREIRRRFGAGPHVPIVAFTANAFEEDVRACRDAGMDDFIAKPVQKAAFIGATLKALTQHAVPDAPLFSPKALKDLVEALDLARVAKLTDIFASETTARLQRIAEGRLDPVTLTRELHSLKSEAGLVGAARLSRLAADAENRLRRDPHAQLPELPHLDSAFAGYRRELADADLFTMANSV